MTEECKAILDFIDCSHELLPGKSNLRGIAERFNVLSEQGKADGFYPLIIIPSDTLVEALEIFLEDNGVENLPESIAANRQRVIESANEVDVRGFFSSRLEEVLDDYSDGDYDILGKFAQSAPQTALGLHTLDYSPCEEVIIARIPARKPWELAAWIPMGGFNDCPIPAVQVAVFQYWHEKFGAIPAAVSFETWEMVLSNPPLTEEDADMLAKEHLAFCRDAVEQGAETIGNLAGSLVNSTAWFFWWD